MQRTFEFFIDDSCAGLRLDQFLYNKIGAVSRMFLANLIEQKAVFVNDAIALKGYHLQTNDRITLAFAESAETAMTPENLWLDVLFEDAEILVVNKPSGMLAHPTKQIKTGTLANALAYHLNFDPQSAIRNAQLVRPGIVHRLDKQTSGLMVIAKTNRAHRILSDHFQRKLVKKLYVALVNDLFEENDGVIDAPIGRTEEKPHWRILASGKAAQTRFSVLEKRGDTTLLELEPITGRTNQLRIHCAHLGHPIVGDQWYGGSAYARLCLHAAKLAFFHPNGGWLEFAAETPKEFAQIY